MVVSSEPSSSHMLFVTQDVISKTRSELVDTGELDETVLNELEAMWKTKMIQAGLISGAIERPIPTHVVAQDQKPLPEVADTTQFPRSNPSMEPVDSVKIERDGFFIPQQDGANDEEEDEDDELLNLDDDEEVAGTDDDDANIPHLVMCQFTKVKRTKNKWEPFFKSGVMQINGKNILFSEGKGEFHF